MKKVSIIISSLILVFIITNASLNAQSIKNGEKYFIGKWNLMVYGLPDGDTKMILNIEKKDNKLTGNLGDPTESEPPLELANIVIADSSLNASFIAQGMDITLMFKIKDAKNITGYMMDMFEIKGTKEN